MKPRCCLCNKIVNMTAELKVNDELTIGVCNSCKEIVERYNSCNQQYKSKPSKTLVELIGEFSDFVLFSRESINRITRDNSKKESIRVREELLEGIKKLKMLKSAKEKAIKKTEEVCSNLINNEDLSLREGVKSLQRSLLEVLLVDSGM